MGKNNKTMLGVMWVAAAAAFGLGWHLAYPWVAAGGAIGLGYLLWRVACRARRAPAKPSNAPLAEPKPSVPRPAQPADPRDLDALFKQMLAQRRYALLLRRQVANSLTDEQLSHAREALEAGMGLVPDGEVVLGRVDEALEDGELDEEEIAACQGRVIRVEHFFLDRYPVSNRQFYDFVAAGGYEQIALWEEKIWPAVLDFVDRSGQPGPRFWKDGCYEPGLEDHPVVGVSWYEAAAYARWLGKRLPTDAEWVKAGSWPVAVSDATRVQRKYPWGETMDRSRANLWGSGPGRTVPVDQFPDGVSVGGVYQLIGNVWEWIRGDFRPGGPFCEDLVLEVPMKSIRGGAFDTYFDNQATCQFQSGEVPMARKRNIGFRCAVGVCDLMLGRPARPCQTEAEPQRAPMEEVGV